MARTNEPLMISGIRRDGGTQMRVSLDEATIERYADEMRNGRWEWGPHNYLVVFHDKSERPEGVYWLADGFHRIEAAQRAGWASVKCRVEDGGRRDAVLLAAGANASHGLSRSRDDVQRAIRALLLDDEWRKWSNRAIAEKVRCDHKTVGSLREKLIESGEIPHEEERTFIRNGVAQTQAAPPPPPARPAGAPSLAEYEAAVNTLGSCGYVLKESTRTDGQRGCPPYGLFTPGGTGVRRLDTWAEVYAAMIEAANNESALAQLRLTIGADKAVDEERHAALQAAISRRVEQLASPAAEALPPELERVAEALRLRDIDAGYAAARAASPYYERAMAAVDALVDGKPLDELMALLRIPYASEQKRQQAAPKAKPERITIQTDKGPTKVLPIFRTEHIALAPFGGSYSITHLESGARIGPEIKDRHLAEQRYHLLAELDWSAGLSDELRLRAREIFGLDNEPENIRISQLHTRATALGCNIVTYHNRRSLLRQGQEIAATGSLGLDHLEEIIAGVERADRIADLTTRAAKFNYSFTPHGGKWRLMRGSDKMPMGAVNDLDELEQSVRSWEQASERAQAEEPAQEAEQEVEQAEQVAPAAPAEARHIQLEHIKARLAGLMDRLSTDELRLVFFLTFGCIPDEQDEGEEALWKEAFWNVTTSDLLNTMSDDDRRWVVGELEAVPQ